ncbi:hypothetical protein, partial [Psittacicella gerlachiana]
MKKKNLIISLGVLVSALALGAGAYYSYSLRDTGANPAYNYKYKLTDVTFEQLPDEIKEQRIDPTQVRLTFTTTARLKE